MTSRILSLAYGLRIHRLDGWAAALPVAAIALLLGQWLLRGLPVLPLWHWLAIVALILAAGAVLWLRGWAARRQYVVFVPDASPASPAEAPLDPADKVKLYATGRFAVQGKSRVFADLLAYWRTFATREHAVMAIAHASRFLLAGRPMADVGMWYVFVKPEEIQASTPGRLTFGKVTRPALRVAYRAALAGHGASRRSSSEGRPVLETVYLGFDDEPARERVWADLLADADG